MTRFLAFCVRRKVTVAMLTATTVLFGLMSWFRMDREFMPELQFPQLTVLTSYANASSQEVENLVTKVIEEAAGTVKNVHRIHSSTREGISVVTVEFLWGTNMDMASLNLREKVDLAKGKLPRDSGEPRIEKFNPFALPVLSLSLSGSRSDTELLALARRPVGELLEKTRGVAAVAITGGREREILVELDQGKLSARGLPILGVGQAISRANITYPAGTVKDKTFEYVVRVLGAFEKVEDLNQISVAVDRTRLSSALSPQEMRRKKQQGPGHRESPQPIALGSLGHIADTFADASSFSRYDGHPNISISILKQADANIVRVADAVKEKLPEVRSKLPADVHLAVVYDQSLFVKSGIRGLLRDGLVGGFLAFLVLVVFLGNTRDATVVSLAIPISVLTAVFIMSSKGMSLNTITLAGLAIGLGHLVDGAIVVQENIARRRSLGRSPEDASTEGAAEVFGAVTSSIFTSVAVFLPLVFVTGVIGQVFKDLSWSVIFSQLVSLVVAFTLIPMMAAAISTPSPLRGEGEGGGDHPHPYLPPSRGKEIIGGFSSRARMLLDRLDHKAVEWVEKYNQCLSYTLENPAQIVRWAFGGCLVSLVVLSFLPRSVFPEIEGDQILLRLDMPVGTSLETTNRFCLKIEEAVQGLRGIEHRAVTVGSIPQEGLQPLGSHQAQVVLSLARHWRPSTKRIVEKLKGRFQSVDLSGGRLYFFEQGGGFSFLAGQEAPVVVEVKGHDLKKLESVSRDIGDRLKGVRGLFNVRTSVSEPAPELQLEVKRDALANLSLSVADLAETVLTAIKGKVVSKFREAGKEIDIRLRLRPEDRQNIDAVETLYVHSPLDVDVPLGSVAAVQKGQGPSEIIRYDQQRTVLVSADLAKRSLDSVAAEINGILADFQEDGVSFGLAGESARMAESFGSLKIVLIFSILFVFMIMAAQFESLWQPLVLLFTIPLALIGMAPALLITGHKVSAMAGMGLILLAGIVVNNGIVLVDFVNQSRQAGLPLREALRHACNTRLRPIIMTASTTILGMLPLSLGIGEGAGMQAPLAVVVVSGLFVSTLLTLLVVPALFVIMEEKVMDRQGRAQLVADGMRQWRSYRDKAIAFWQNFPSPWRGEGEGGGGHPHPNLPPSRGKEMSDGPLQGGGNLSRETS
jgi:hydrophobic/amphiphilic exporter-1 (mainly G- bacteria), HAE1 family